MASPKQQQDGRILAVVGGVVVLLAAILIIAGFFDRRNKSSVAVQRTITNQPVAPPAIAAVPAATPATVPASAPTTMAFGNTVDSLRAFAKKYPDDPLVQALRNPQFGDADVLPFGNSDKGLMGGQKLRADVARIRRMDAFDHSNPGGVIAAQRVLGDRCATQVGHNEPLYRECKKNQRAVQHKAFAGVSTDAGNAHGGMLNPEGVQNTMINIPSAS